MNDELQHDFWEEDCGPLLEEEQRADVADTRQWAIEILNTASGVELGEKLTAMQAQQKGEALFLRTRRKLIQGIKYRDATPEQKEALTQWFENEVTREWFHEQVWPIIKALATDETSLHETAETVFYAVFRLVRRQTSQGDRELTLNAINTFLSTEYLSLYKRYGPSVANAVANDARLGSDAWTPDTADQTWKPLKKKLTPKQLDAIAVAFTYRESEEAQQTFLREIPRVLDAIAAEDDLGMKGDFLWILKDGAGGEGRGFMPVLDPEKMVMELRVLRFRKQEAVFTIEELMDPDQKLASSPSPRRHGDLLALLTIAINEYPGAIVTFFNDEQPNHQVVHLSNAIIGAQQAADTPEEVDDLLETAIMHHHGLGPQLFPTLACAKPIKDSFPSLDGKPPFESFLLYMKEIYEHNPFNETCMNALIQQFGNPKNHGHLPQKNRDAYMEVGLGVIKYLREHATPYFDWRQFNPRLLALLEENPDAFAQAMDGAKTCAFQFMVLPPAILRRRNTKGGATEDVLKLYLRFWGDPRFDDMLRGLDVLRHTINRMLEDTPEGKETALLMAHFRNVVRAYAMLVIGLAAKNEEGRLPERDFEADAQRMALRMLVKGATNFVFPDEYPKYVKYAIKGDKDELDATRDMLFGKKKRGSRRFTENLDHTLAVTRALRQGAVLPHMLDHTGYDAERTNPPNNKTGILDAAPTTALPLRDSLAGGPMVLNPAAPITVQTEDTTARRLKLREAPQTALIRFVQREVRESMRTAFWRHAMGFDDKGNLDMPPTDVESEAWLMQANQSTRFAASTAGLFAALGLHEVIPNFYELPQYLPTSDIEPLARDDELDALREQNGFRIKDILERLEVDGAAETIRQRIRALLPPIAKWIRAERMKLPGLMAVGLKTQTHKEVSPADLRFVLDLGKMGDIRTSPFQLKHAQKSLVLPPLPSTLELKWLTMLFYMFGVTDDKKPQLQLTGGGRWPSHVANVAGASLLLASPTDLEYAKGAFASQGHDYYSDAHMLVYGAGVRDNSLPFDLPKAHGRTDVQGRHDLDDLDWWQLLNTAANHHTFEGPFQRLWRPYQKNFLEELGRNGDLFLWFLSAAWCHDWRNPQDAVEQHDDMIAAFLQARRDSPEIVDHVQGLVHRHITRPLVERRPEILRRYPNQIRALQNF